MSDTGGPMVIQLLQPAVSGRGSRTLASAIYGHLRGDILACRYQPGEKLMIDPLAKRFDVSVAAVREALSRLVADGLVVAEDQRGFRVSSLSLADLSDVTHSRIEIECVALRRSIMRGGAEWRANLVDAWEKLDAAPHLAPGDDRRHHEAWSELHDRFHGALVAACGLGWLLRFRKILFEQSERYRRISLALVGKSRSTREEHLRIFEAALRGDTETATRELAEHFELTARMIMDAYPSRGESEVLSPDPGEEGIKR